MRVELSISVFLRFLLVVVLVAFFVLQLLGLGTYNSWFGFGLAVYALCQGLILLLKRSQPSVYGWLYVIAGGGLAILTVSFA